MSLLGAPGPPAGRELPLAEFPLDPGPRDEELVSETTAAELAPRQRPSAAFPARLMAATADLASAVLGVSLPIVAAAALRGRWPTAAGLVWAAGFGVTLSLATTVATLFLFGKTAGMALAGLSVRPDSAGRRMAVGQAALRWTGTLLTVLTLGLPLLWTSRNPEAKTPADLLSDRPLLQDVEVEG